MVRRKMEFDFVASGWRPERRDLLTVRSELWSIAADTGRTTRNEVSYGC